MAWEYSICYKLCFLPYFAINLSSQQKVIIVNRHNDFITHNFDNVKGTVFEKLVQEYGKDNVMRVVKRSINSEFKRYPHPIPIDIFRKEIVKKL